ncbi:MAG: von Willebrand factor type A domain-containing protein [Myxococcota bacterium]|nr:von Willebrand factor type A domain-containing protein [Myxococcota bacterium]
MTRRTLRPSAIILLALIGCSQKETTSMAPVSSATPPLQPPAELQASSNLYSYGDAPVQDVPAVIHPAPVAVASAAESSETNDFFQDEPIPESVQYKERTEIDFEGMDIMVAPGMGAEADAALGPRGMAVRSQKGVAYGRGSAGGSFGAMRRNQNSAALQSAPMPPRQAQANTEQYTHYGVGGLTLTSADRLSTFAIDVDTASYTIARRKLNNESLPPTASVRVEEFVNALSYNYAGPQDDTPFRVHMEAAPNPIAEGHHILQVGVQGKEVNSEDRKPVRLTFLVDTSGSMQSTDKIALAKRSLHFLVDQLGEEDSVSLATYAGSVSRVLEPTTLDEKAKVHNAIEQLTAGGSTAMNSGIGLAYQMARESFVPGAENRVIVLSDGDANVGPSSHTEILSTIRQYAEQGITLSTIGFGMGNYKDTMMEQLANKGDGNYFYIDQFAEAKKVFGQKLAGTIQTIAKDVKIQVEFNPNAVVSYRLIGYENRDIADKDFRNDRVDAGEIGSGHTVTALYDVVLAPQASESELATVRIRHKKAGRDAPASESSTPFSSSNLVASFSSASDNLQMAYSAASFAELLRGSPYANELSYGQVWKWVQEASRTGSAEDQELLGLIATAARLTGEETTVAMP